MDHEQQEAIEQQTMQLSAVSYGEQREVGSRGARDGGRVSLMEVDEEDSRGGMRRCGLQGTMKVGLVTWMQ